MLEKTYLADVSALRTLDLFDQLKPHPLIDGDIGLALGTFQVARHTLPICLLHDIFHQPLPHSHSTSLRTNGYHVAKVVTTWVCPEGVVCILLHLLPDPVSRNIQATTAEEANIVHELPEGEQPLLRPGRPSQGCVCSLR